MESNPLSTQILRSPNFRIDWLLPLTEWLGMDIIKHTTLDSKQINETHSGSWTIEKVGQTSSVVQIRSHFSDCHFIVFETSRNNSFTWYLIHLPDISYIYLTFFDDQHFKVKAWKGYGQEKMTHEKSVLKKMYLCLFPRSRGSLDFSHVSIPSTCSGSNILSHCVTKLYFKIFQHYNSI
jgi:hypothetical protein